MKQKFYRGYVKNIFYHTNAENNETKMEIIMELPETGDHIRYLDIDDYIRGKKTDNYLTDEKINEYYKQTCRVLRNLEKQQNFGLVMEWIDRLMYSQAIVVENVIDGKESHRFILKEIVLPETQEYNQ